MAFNSLDTILDFLDPINKFVISGDEEYINSQIGSNIDVYEESFPDLQKADIVIVGCSDSRGAGGYKDDNDSVNAVRKEFYNLFHWHKEVRLADAGNVKPGAGLQDTYAALRTVVGELSQHCRRVVILGGSHDLSFAQYNVYVSANKIIEAVCVDAVIDMKVESSLPANNYLMPMLTGEPAANEGDAVAIAAGAELGGAPRRRDVPELGPRQRRQPARRR